MSSGFVCEDPSEISLTDSVVGSSIPSEILASLWYLSSVNDDIRENVYKGLESKIGYIPKIYKPYFDWYIDWYKNYETFPSFDQTKDSLNLSGDVKLTFRQAMSVYNNNLAIWETDSIAERIQSMPLLERRTLVERMAKVLQNDVVADTKLASAGDFDIDKFIVTKDKVEKAFKFPIRHLNDKTVIVPGNTISVLAGPGNFKTHFALNTLYLNCIKGDMRSLYIYLENVESAYQAELRSRFSYDTATKVENSALKKGVLDDDVEAVKVVRSLDSEFKRSKKGEVFFKPFTSYRTDPLLFASQLAKDVVANKIDIVVFDYLQRAKAFAPLRQDGMAYLNQLMSVITSTALGGFDSTPFVSIVLAQPNREGQARAIKSRGNSLNLTSIAEVSSIERDSFVSIALYADAEGKAANQMGYKIIKNRDQEVDIMMSQTTVIPQYCYIGDMTDATDNVYSSSMLDSVFDGLD